MTEETVHQSVLTDEVIEYIKPKSGGIYLDTTFGGGGHARAILAASEPAGELIGIDRDSAVTEFAQPLKDEFPERFRFECMSYTNAAKLDQLFDGILMDLGLSSDQLDESGRGFSFSRLEPLDMRFDSTRGQSASQFLNQSSVKEIEKVFREYGEDKHAGQLSRKIVASRRAKPFHTTFDFISSVGTTSPKVLSRLFQALRIQVNDELYTLKAGLETLEKLLKPGGIIVVISFHSLEDRIVKEFARSNLTVITKKPITASSSELARNPRSRSAKLRAGQKIVDSHQEIS